MFSIEDQFGRFAPVMSQESLGDMMGAILLAQEVRDITHEDEVTTLLLSRESVSRTFVQIIKITRLS